MSKTEWFDNWTKVVCIKSARVCISACIVLLFLVQTLKLHTLNCFREKETRIQHSGIAQPCKHAYTWTNDLVSTWLPDTKSLWFKSPNRSLQTGNEPSLKQRKNKVVGHFGLKVRGSNPGASIEFNFLVNFHLFRSFRMRRLNQYGTSDMNGKYFYPMWFLEVVYWS